MDFKTYIPLAIRTAKMFPSLVQNLEHSAIGLLTESGEIASEIKRVAIYGKPLTDEMKAHLREEIGDVAWYVALGCSVLSIDKFESAGALKGNEQLIDAAHAFAIAAGATCGAIMAIKMAPPLTGDAINSFSKGIDLTREVLEIMCKMLEIDFGEVLDENIAKLRLRYPDAYSDEAAEARADKGGLDHRVS